MTDTLIQTAIATFGAPGLFIAFLIWDRTQQARQSKEREDADRAVQKERTAADLEMARALTALAVKVDHVR